MPKNTVSDPITDQEMAFAHLILSGTMNDRHAAGAVGLNPEPYSPIQLFFPSTLRTPPGGDGPDGPAFRSA
jgi:hypothetical protein